MCRFSVLWDQNKAVNRQYHWFKKAELNGSSFGGKFCFAIIILQLLAINAHRFNLVIFHDGENTYMSTWILPVMSFRYRQLQLRFFCWKKNISRNKRKQHFILCKSAIISFWETFNYVWIFYVGFLCAQYAPETALCQITTPLSFQRFLCSLCVKHIHWGVGGQYDRTVTFFQCCWLWHRKLLENDCYRAEKIIGCSSLLILSAAPATRDCITRC